MYGGGFAKAPKLLAHKPQEYHELLAVRLSHKNMHRSSNTMDRLCSQLAIEIKNQARLPHPDNLNHTAVIRE